MSDFVPVYLDCGTLGTPNTPVTGYVAGPDPVPDWLDAPSTGRGYGRWNRSYEIGFQDAIPSDAQLKAWADHIACDGEQIPGMYDLEWQDGAGNFRGSPAAVKAILQASKTYHPAQRIGAILTGVTGINTFADQKSSGIYDLLDYVVAGVYLSTISAADDGARLALYQQLTQSFIDANDAIADAKPLVIEFPLQYTNPGNPYQSTFLIQGVCSYLRDLYAAGEITAVIVFAGFNPTFTPWVTATYDPYFAGIIEPTFGVGTQPIPYPAPPYNVATPAQVQAGTGTIRLEGTFQTQLLSA